MSSIVLFIVILFILYVFFIFSIRFILKKVFYHKPVKNTTDIRNAGFNYVEKFIKGRQNQRLQAFLIHPQNNGPVVIGIHGWANTVSKLFALAKFLEKSGLRLLLINARNHGESDQEGYTTIVKFREDMNAGLEFIRKEYGQNTTVILLGHSLGAATCICIAANDEHISGVISVASFSKLDKLLASGFLKGHFPKWLIIPVLKYLEHAFGEKLENLSPHNNIKKIKQPLLLIHGGKDRTVSPSDFEELKQNANANFLQSHYIAEADHSSMLQDEKTFSVIENFITGHFMQQV